MRNKQLDLLLAMALYLSLSLLALLLLDLLLGIEQLVLLHMDPDLLLVLDRHNQQSKQLLTLFYLLVATSYARALPLLLIDWINRMDLPRLNQRNQLLLNRLTQLDYLHMLEDLELQLSQPNQRLAKMLPLVL
jgi:hypothetical protein